MLFRSSGDEHSDFKFIQDFDEWFNNVRDKYLEGAKVFINSPKLTMTVFAVIVVSIIGLFKLVPTGFLPVEDKGAIFTQIQLPDGSSASRTDLVANEIEEQLLKIPGIKNTITMVGFSGENTAFIVSELDDWSKRKSKDLQMTSILSKIQKNVCKLSVCDNRFFLSTFNFRFGYVRRFRVPTLG